MVKSECHSAVHLSSFQVRIFTYLIGREAAFADNLKWMACANKGSMRAAFDFILGALTEPSLIRDISIQGPQQPQGESKETGLTDQA
ncbi:hypothetical protein P7K49_030587 [Saguinus oedipus]|uniref:Uncharacterized protein n=1 Tax=Saguinus oedipus TaxID=9490 RepID=A0ABQ9U2L3_SAGOE|nr:hypothetical protein P7K49_030587 [Saguinus oedipus]